MKNINTLFISFFCLFGCTSNELVTSKQKRINSYEIFKDDHRNKAKDLGMSYVDYLHMINSGKKQIPKSLIKYRHTIEKESGENCEIVYKKGFFNSYGKNSLKDNNLNIDYHLFFIDSLLNQYDYYVEILDSLFEQEKNGILIKIKDIKYKEIVFEEDNFIFVASQYRILRVKRNEYTESIISCINHEIKK